jgi:PST family polysaccharide transporter
VAFKAIAFGTAAMSCVGILRILAQFLVIPILSRLLSPADYGVVAMAMPFVLFTMIFTDAGVGQSLIRTAQKEEGIWSTSFWLTIFLGLGLGLMIAIMAPAGAFFFEEPRLQPIVLALSAVVLLQAGATIPEASLRKNHRFGIIASTEMTAVAAGIAMALIVALNGGGAWALVAQQITLYGTRFLLTFWLSCFRPRMTFNLQGLKEHLVFGRDVLSANFVTFLTQSVDTFIIGKILGPVALGLYTMAFLFARLPARLIAGPLQYVIYAHLAPVNNDKAAVRHIFLLLTRLLSVFIFPAMGMVAIAWHPVFTLLLSDKWLHSGAIFMLAAPAAALQTVTTLRGTFMMVMGRTDVQLRSNIEFFSILIVALLASVHFGIEWAVVGYSCAVFLYFPRSMALILPLIECRPMAYLRAMAVPVAVAMACAVAYTEINQLLSPGDWVQLFIGGGFGVLGIAASLLIQYRPLSLEIAFLREATKDRS